MSDRVLRLTVPLSQTDVAGLCAGDRVLISGSIYTARDAAHKRIVDACRRGEALPFAIDGQVIYYAGPCPAGPGKVIGSIGPTTSGRMDSYAPTLIKLGLKGMIGKGERSREVVEAMQKYGSAYFVAVGGAGALLSGKVKSVELVAYEDLGTEAVRRLEVEDFPVIVAIDSNGRNLYEEGPEKYRIGG